MTDAPPIRRAIVLGALVFAGCGDDSTGPADCIASPSLSIRPAGLVMEPGESGRTLAARGTDACGEPTPVAGVEWLSSAPDVATIDASGLLDAEVEGQTTIVARSGALEDSATVFVFALPSAASMAPRGLGIQIAAEWTTDLWVHGDYALTGSSFGGGACPSAACVPHAAIVWDLSDPDRPVVVGEIPTQGAVVNDVKISADGRFAVATMEGGASGIVLIDMQSPRGPAAVDTYRGSLDRGIHNVWIEEIDGAPYVFAAEDGENETSGLHVLNVSDLTRPVEVDRFRGGPSSVHDVYVRDGLAFVSHWDDGLVILDVGNGMSGGSPSNVVEVSRIDLDGETHNAWYWPAAALVFVGEEDFVNQGKIHVVDVGDLAAPVRVATITDPGGATPHNFWVDETREILYVGWYDRGLVAIDVSGTLSGELGTSRDLAVSTPSGPLGPASFWAPQLHGGRIYVADGPHGLWVFDPP